MHQLEQIAPPVDSTESWTWTKTKTAYQLICLHGPDSLKFRRKALILLAEETLMQNCAMIPVFIIIFKLAAYHYRYSERKALFHSS